MCSNVTIPLTPNISPRKVNPAHDVAIDTVSKPRLTKSGSCDAIIMPDLQTSTNSAATADNSHSNYATNSRMSGLTRMKHSEIRDSGRNKQIRRSLSLENIPVLHSCRVKEDKLNDAHRCSRNTIRRNALNDPEKMAMPQQTRERIQKDVILRKQSISRKMAQLIRTLYDKEVEVDLI